MFGLATIWLHLFQARAPTVEEAVKLLTPLLSTGSDCPYTLVQFNRDAHHVPLRKEWQLSIQVMGGTGSATCRRVSQLQVCQLLSSGCQVVYPAGLSGCEVPLITSLPEPMTKGSRRTVVLWPSGRWRPEWFPRLSPFNSHTTKLFSTLKRNLLKRRERVNSTSLHLPGCTTGQPSRTLQHVVASYHILLGHTPMSHLFSILQGAPPFPPGPAPGTFFSSCTRSFT